MSWKIHNEVSKEIICIRQQEVMIQGEFVGQIAVRFVTDQVSFSLVFSPRAECHIDPLFPSGRVWRLEMRMESLLEREDILSLNE